MYFIAELCQNHQGDIEVLQNMVRLAAQNGATHVKIQSIFTDDLVYRPEFEIDSQSPLYVFRPYSAELNRLRSLELNLDDHKRFIDICVSHDVIPLTTVFSKNSLDKISNISWPVPIVKIASYDCASLPLIISASETFSKLIISTGATYDAEVAHTAQQLTLRNIDFTYLHCVTSYPQQIQDARLLRMNWLSQFTRSVGFSDHSPISNPLMLSMCAIYLGASYIERHFTILDEHATKDGPVSIRPHELKLLTDFASQSRSEQLAKLHSEFGPSLLSQVFTYQSGMSTFNEVINRQYYRGRFGSVENHTVTNNWI